MRGPGRSDQPADGLEAWFSLLSQLDLTEVVVHQREREGERTTKQDTDQGMEGMSKGAVTTAHGTELGKGEVTTERKRGTVKRWCVRRVAGTGGVPRGVSW